MHQHATSDQDRRVALSWIGRQLAWENRLQTLREDPPGEPAEDTRDDVADEVADEVDSAA
jgi:hypothetical protein